MSFTEAEKLPPVICTNALLLGPAKPPAPLICTLLQISPPRMISVASPVCSARLSGEPAVSTPRMRAVPSMVTLVEPLTSP